MRKYAIQAVGAFWLMPPGMLFVVGSSWPQALRLLLSNWLIHTLCLIKQDVT